MHNKQSLTKDIEALEKSVAMEVLIRETLAEFKHYRQVNKRFITALEDKGLNAYLLKDGYSTTLCINPPRYNSKDCFGFHLYISHVMKKGEITWAMIEESLTRHDFAGRLKERNDMLQVFEQELCTVKKAMEELNKLEKLSCFSLYGCKRELESLIDFAEHNLIYS